MSNPAPPIALRLYVTGAAPNSRLALNHLESLKPHLPPGSRVEIIDLLRDPAAAQTDGVVLSPTLVILGPSGPAHLAGTLSDLSKVRRALGLEIL